MAYDQHLADRVRELLVDREDVTEKLMFSGICFMVDDKMCVCVTSSGLLCRIGADRSSVELERSECTQMLNNGRVMKDYVYVADDHFDQKKLRYWVDACLAFNPRAKASKRK